MYIHIYCTLYTNIYMCTCMYIIDVDTRNFVNIIYYTDTCNILSIYMYIYVHMCTCMYMYVHVCTCTFVTRASSAVQPLSQTSWLLSARDSVVNIINCATCSLRLVRQRLHNASSNNSAACLRESEVCRPTLNNSSTRTESPGSSWILKTTLTASSNVS